MSKQSNPSPRSHAIQCIFYFALLLSLLMSFAAQSAKQAYYQHLVRPDVSTIVAAAQNGSADDVEAAIRKGADVNLADDSGRTALMRAAETGRIGSCELLVRHGARMEAKTCFDWTPLMFAANAREKSTVRWLIRHGADVNHQTTQGVTPLMVAARTGDLETCLDLLAAGARVDAKTRGGRTAIFFAADCEDGAAVVAELLHRGSNRNDSDDEGRTPLMEAISAQNTNVAAVLASTQL